MNGLKEKKFNLSSGLAVMSVHDSPWTIAFRPRVSKLF